MEELRVTVVLQRHDSNEERQLERPDSLEKSVKDFRIENCLRHDEVRARLDLALEQLQLALGMTAVGLPAAPQKNDVGWAIGLPAQSMPSLRPLMMRSRPTGVTSHTPTARA